MIKHLFKLIWNQKRKNLGLLFEFFFSFLVLFAVLTFIIYNFSRYREPLGFDYQDRWEINLSWNAMPEEERAGIQEQFKDQLKNYPEIEAFSFSNGNTPYGYSTHINGVKYEGKEASPHVFFVDENYLEMYDLSLTGGRWFEPADQVSEKRPIIINPILQKELFGEENPLGKEIEYGDEIRKVIGTYDHYKYRGEFSAASSQMFVGVAPEHVFQKIILHIKPNTGARFEGRMLKDMSQLAKGVTVTVNYLDEMRDNMLLQIWLPMTVFLIISGFLIFNVALGLFGVLWQNINIRKGEIGVRRAVGATQFNIAWQFIGEVLVLSSLAMIVGTFFAIQFPLLGVFGLSRWVYLSAIGAAIFVIYTLVAICAFFPSRQASQLHPALALHEE